MNVAVDILLTSLLLVVGSWVLCFGGIGAAFARSRSVSTWGGFTLGVLLGPLGWLLMWLIARSRTVPAEGGGAADFAGSDMSAAVGSVAVDATPTPRLSDLLDL